MTKTHALWFANKHQKSMSLSHPILRCEYWNDLIKTFIWLKFLVKWSGLHSTHNITGKSLELHPGSSCARISFHTPAIFLRHWDYDENFELVMWYIDQHHHVYITTCVVDDLSTFMIENWTSDGDLITIEVFVGPWIRVLTLSKKNEQKIDAGHHDHLFDIGLKYLHYFKNSWWLKIYWTLSFCYKEKYSRTIINPNGYKCPKHMHNWILHRNSSMI